jgi:hypothetical protein
MSDALFQRVLGTGFDSLSPLLKALHLAPGLRLYRGQVQVERGAHPIARVLAWATRLPPAGQGEVRVEIDAREQCEKWTRHIHGHAMPSRLWSADGLLYERLGLATFGFRLSVERGAIVWRVARVAALGLPLPARWFDGVIAHESVEAGRYCFDVRAALPVAGLLVRYRGWLDVPST